jgi:hypothetical protein
MLLAIRRTVEETGHRLRPAASGGSWVIEVAEEYAA